MSKAAQRAQPYQSLASNTATCNPYGLIRLIFRPIMAWGNMQGSGSCPSYFTPKLLKLG